MCRAFYTRNLLKQQFILSNPITEKFIVNPRTTLNLGRGFELLNSVTDFDLAMGKPQ